MVALQSSCCPGSATFAHLWGPVCAGLLLAPQDQYGSVHMLQQHQAPGIVQMLPVLRQMGELQQRTTQAAAELVAAALQADAAVLHGALSATARGSSGSSSVSSSTGRRWLVDAAPDIVELSTNNAAHYTCAPSVWFALTGCGHAVVSASLIAAAADLAPLSGVAAAAASRLQACGPSVRQQLDASLQLPDADAADVGSTRHAVFAVDAAGWLQQQLLRATGALAADWSALVPLNVRLLGCTC
jgi:hypothetical protein